MKMKKILLLTAAALCAGTIAMARVPNDEGAMGGIVPGMTKEEVIAIYGAPKEGKVTWAAAWGPHAEAQIIGYGDSVTMNCVRDSGRPFRVTMIHITANNGFSTPSGIHVGSTRSEVIGTYGEPDIHYGDALYYKTDSGVNLVFHMRNGRVASMNLGWDA